MSKEKDDIRAMLKIDGIIYNEQPREVNFDYHPQKITKINDDSIEVFEEGYCIGGKYFKIEINKLRLLDGNEIVHGTLASFSHT